MDAIAKLPEGLRKHIFRVEEEAARFAALHEVDEQRARLAALGHDLVRHLKGDELLSRAAEYGIAPDEVERGSPVLIHGPVAAAILRRDYGFDDAEVLAGIDCHTTARAGMSKLEQVLFVADKVEPRKLEREPELGDVRRLAKADLDAAVVRYLDLNLQEAIHRGWQVHHRTIEARNELIRRLAART